LWGLIDIYIGIVDAGTEKSAMVDEQAEEHSSSTRAKRARFIAPPPTAGDKLDWSSEEDLDSYETPNAQKAKKQKRAKAEGYRAKAVSKTNQGDKSSKGRRKEENRHYLYGENKDEGDELLDEEIPEYYKKRKTMFENTFERLKEAGLRLPPKYDGITFSEDDRRDALKEKPVFPRSTPGAADEDVALDRSAGIIPAPIAKWLRSYQVIGVQFLHEHFVYQRGGILGDDMLSEEIEIRHNDAKLIRRRDWAKPYK
jgi:DNA excision repair protein ERCC-6-like 2